MTPFGAVKIAGVDVPRFIERPTDVELAAGATAKLDAMGLLGASALTIKGSWQAATATTGVASGTAYTGTTTTSIVKPDGADNWTADDFNGKHARVSTYDAATIAESGAGSLAITADSPGQSALSVEVVVGAATAVRYLDFFKKLVITVLEAGSADDDIAALINTDRDCHGLLTAVSAGSGDFTEAISKTAMTGGAVSVVAITDTTTSAIALAEAVTGLAAGAYFEVVDPAVVITDVVLSDCQAPLVIEDCQITALDADRLTKLTLRRCVVGAASVDDCAVVSLDACGQVTESPAVIVVQNCGNVAIDDGALTGAYIRMIDCQNVTGDAAVATPIISKLTAALTADGGDLAITGENLLGGMTFDSAAITLGDEAGTLTVTAVKPGDSGLSVEILASDTGTSLGVSVEGSVVTVQLSEAGDSAAEIAALINTAAEETDGILRATASGSGDTTSAVAATALSGGTGDYAATKVLVGGVEALPANEADGVAQWSDTGIVATVADDHAEAEIVAVTVTVDGEVSNTVTYLVGAGL